MPVCEVDLRVGGRWRYVWRRTNGVEMEMIGEYREVIPGVRIINTENWGAPWPETLNTLTLTALDGGHTVITQDVRHPSLAARDAAMATGMRDGADRSYARLDAVLAATS